MWGVMQKLTWGTVAAVAALGLSVHADTADAPAPANIDGTEVDADDFPCGYYRTGMVYSAPEGEELLVDAVDIWTWDDCVLLCFRTDGCRTVTGDTMPGECRLFSLPSSGDPVATYEEGSWAYWICDDDLPVGDCEELGTEMSSTGDCTDIRISTGGSNESNWGGVHHVLPESVSSTLPYSSRVFISVGCEGTLVNWNAVVTAAHCLEDVEEGLIFPALYGNEEPFGSYTFTADNIITHENYIDIDSWTVLEHQWLDFAIIILDSDVAVPDDSEDDTLEIGPASIRATSLDETISPMWMINAPVDLDTSIYSYELHELGPGSMTVIQESVTDGDNPQFAAFTLEDIRSWDGWSGAAIFDDDFFVVGVNMGSSRGIAFDCTVAEWVFDALLANPPVDHNQASLDGVTCDITPNYEDVQAPQGTK